MERRVVVCSQHKRIGDTYPVIQVVVSGVERVVPCRLDNTWTIVWAICAECAAAQKKKMEALEMSEEAWR